MFKKILIFILPIFVLSEKLCFDSDLITNFYKELGCTPMYENDSKCPTSYDCDIFESRNKGQCRYHNISYPLGSELTTSDVLKGCGAQSCKCIEGADGNPVFSCANSECFTRWPEDRSCVQIFDEGSCCSDKFHCKGKDPELPECSYGGKTYVKGQVIYPDDEPCKKCYCKEGSQVVCEDVSCDTELHSLYSINKNCVPVYYGANGCCPIDWKCPSNETLKIVTSEERQESVTASKCKFGDFKLNQFDALEIENQSNVRCRCLVPPYVTCTQKPYESSQ